VSCLFEGEILRRDSRGFVQPIMAGAVNLTTAGRGIVHSERGKRDWREGRSDPVTGETESIPLPD